MQGYFAFFCESFSTLYNFFKENKKNQEKCEKTIDKREQMVYNNTENKAELSVLTFLP